MSSSLKISAVSKHFKDVVAVNNVSLEVYPGEFLSILGPSGCGKTTILRMVAGLESPTSGEIAINDRVVSSSSNIVPPEKRSVGMVFQSYAVWPHMTVFNNVAFGLRMKKTPREQIKGLVKEALELVGLGELSGRYPTQLSGGQQQRVALARALVTEPEVLLLDEPLSNLDAKLRESMLFEIRSLQRRLGITTLYVTHSQEEALASSDRIAVMSAGKLQQLDKPQTLYEKPTNRFVAEFIGLTNFLNGKVIANGNDNTCRFELNNGAVVQVTNPCKLSQSDKPLVMVRPEHLRLTRNKPPNQSGAILGRITGVLFVGNIVNYFVDTPLGSNKLRAQSVPPVEFAEGEEVWVSFSCAAGVLVRP